MEEENGRVDFGLGKEKALDSIQDYKNPVSFGGKKITASFRPFMKSFDHKGKKMRLPL